MTTTKKRCGARKSAALIDALYKAAQNYVEGNGGRLFVIGGVEIQEWPEERKNNFMIAVRCTGEKPEFANKVLKGTRK